MTPISPIIRRKVEAADRIYFNAVDLFHTTGHYAERRELPEDADKAKELVKKIAEDVRVLYGPEDPTEIEEVPSEEKKAKERETITNNPETMADEEFVSEHNAWVEYTDAQERRRKAASKAEDRAYAIYHELGDIRSDVIVPADVTRISQLCGTLNDAVSQLMAEIYLEATHREKVKSLDLHSCASPSSERDDEASEAPADCVK